MREVRYYSPQQRFELRAAGEDKLPSIVGYAAVWDSPSAEMGWDGLVEFVRRGAFKRSIREKADVFALVDHLPHLVLGRTASGTLKLKEDDRGLRVTIDPPDTSLGRDTVEILRRGDVSKMSFGFVARRQEYDFSDRDAPKRYLLDVDLLDVSVVAYPAYAATDVGLMERSARRPADLTAGERGEMELSIWRAKVDWSKRHTQL